MGLTSGYWFRHRSKDYSMKTKLIGVVWGEQEKETPTLPLNYFIMKTNQFFFILLLLNECVCGGKWGAESAPLSNICGSPKNAQRTSCQFFVTFHEYVNGVLETSFCSQITLGQNGHSFVKGDPVGSNMKEKLLTQINLNCNMFHITFGFFLCCNIIVSASFGVGNHFLGQGC